MTLRRHVGYRS